MESYKIRNSEAIDICQNNLIETVICNKPSSEGYDVTNLISRKFIEKNKGFLVERFISPPVVLTFEFKCNIYIKYVVICCKVGAQKSSGIEIFSQTEPDTEYISIGSGVLEDNKNGFVFHRFDEEVNNRFGEQYLLRKFRPKTCHHLSSVKKLQIKIFRTSGTSVPGIGKVEFWGVPRQSKDLTKIKLEVCDPRLSKHLSKNKVGVCSPHQSKHLSRNKVGVCGKGTVGLNKDLKCTVDCMIDNCARKLDSPKNMKTHIKPNLSIPEEFLDPITFEVMIQPVIMPSGKIIDNTTMELYEKAERLWGRGPNDPFTSVPFTDSSKPVAATDLKARIDKYLSINSSCTELFNVPRTVGRNCSSISSQANIKAGVSKLIENSTSRSIVDHCSSVSNCADKIESKRQKLDLSLEDVGLLSADKTFKSISSDNTIDNNSNRESKNVSVFKHRPLSFEERMDQSLELALKSTLSKLPNFTAEKQKITVRPVCNVCNSVDNLFIIECNHYVCRNCLTSVNHKRQMLCSSCNFIYKTSDVKKIHLLK